MHTHRKSIPAPSSTVGRSRILFIAGLAGTALAAGIIGGQLRADSPATWTGADAATYNDYWSNSNNWANTVIGNNGSGVVYDVSIPSTASATDADLSGLSPTIGQLITGSGTTIYNSNGTGSGAETLTIDPSTMSTPAGSTLAGTFGSTNSSAPLTLNFGAGNTSAVTSAVTGTIVGYTNLIIDQLTGTVELSGANTYTGTTTITSGTLEFTGSTAGLTGNVTNNSALSFNQTANSSLAGVISGTGTLTENGTTGTVLTLSGANTYSGTTTITSGTLEFTGGTAGMTGNVTNNSALSFNQTANSSLSGIISGSGTVTQNGTATLTFSGANTYTGGTTLNGGTLALSGSGSIADSSAVVVNSGAILDISGTSTGATVNILSGGGGINLGSQTLTVNSTTGNTPIFSGAISGAGGVTLTGGGYFELSGNNTYTGVTDITAGTLLDSSANSLVDSSVDIGASGRLQITTTNGAAVGGLTGSGTLILPSSGALTINVSGGITDTFSGTMENDISINSGIDKTGAGTLILSGTNLGFFGPGDLNAVSGGTLVLENSNALPQAALALNTGILETGLVYTGGASGTNFTIDTQGNYTQSSAATLGLALSGTPGSGSFDKVNVAGAATLAGTLDVLVQSGAKPALGTKANYDIITTSSGVSGGFGSLALAAGSVSGVSLSGAISGNDYVLTLSSGFALSGIGANLTPNQTAVLNYLNTAGNTNTLTGGTLALLQNIAVLPPNQLGAALNQIAPLAYENVPASLINNTIFASQALNGQISGQFNGGGFNTSGLTLLKTTNTDPFSLALASALASDGAVNAQTSSTQYLDDLMPGTTPLPSHETPHDSFGGFVAGEAILGSQPTSVSGQNYFTGGIDSGLDYRFAKSLLVGISFNYSYTNAHIDGVGSVLTDNSYAPGLFAGYRKDNFYVDASADYDYSQFHIHRNVNFGGAVSTASGKPNTNEQDINTLAGYNFPLFSHFKAGPAIGLDYSHISVSSYTETGSPADLAVSAYSIDSLRSLLGGQAQYKLVIPRVPTPLMITANAFWQHEYLNNSHGITASLAGTGGSSFITNVANPGRDSALIGAGISGKVCRYAMLFANYEAQIGPKNQHSQSIMVGMAVNF